jgi:hypothetical protein
VLLELLLGLLLGHHRGASSTLGRSCGLLVWPACKPCLLLSRLESLGSWFLSCCHPAVATAAISDRHALLLLLRLWLAERLDTALLLLLLLLMSWRHAGKLAAAASHWHRLLLLPLLPLLPFLWRMPL